MILKRRTEYALLGAGLSFIFFGGLLNFFSNDDLMESVISEKFIVSESSLIFPYWLKNPFKIYNRMYFFNWTNPSDLKGENYKPKFKEIGPYVFEETSEKVDLTWNDNGTVTYRKVRKWYFEPNESVGTLSDNLTTLNSVAVAAAYVTRTWMTIARKSISIALSGTQGMHITRTIGEITFEGYTDPLLEAGSMIPGLSSLIPFDRFGYLYQMNGTSKMEGIMNIETGANGVNVVGKVRNWNYQNSTNYYKSPCGNVFGSNGDLWPPKRTKKDDVIIFSAELCRYVKFKFTKEVIVNGIKGYRYEPGPELFDNGTIDSTNKCFCSGDCLPSGTLNISSCRFGAPGFASYPHFYQGDPWYRDTIEGMNPNPEKHETYIVLEPTYGLFLETAGRLQLNIMVQPDSDISLYRGIPKIFFPILWMEQKAALPSNLACLLKIMLALPTACYVISILMIVLGCCFLGLFFVSWVQPNKKKLKEINIRIATKDDITTNVEKDVISPLIKIKPKVEIITSRESNI